MTATRPHAQVFADLLRGYLHGQTYTKSKRIASRTDLSVKEVGNILAEIEQADGLVTVRPRAKSSGTTYEVVGNGGE